MNQLKKFNLTWHTIRKRQKSHMYVTVDPLRPRGDPPGGSKILENQFFAYYSSTILQKSTLLGILLDNYKSNICM